MASIQFSTPKQAFPQKNQLDLRFRCQHLMNASYEYGTTESSTKQHDGSKKGKKKKSSQPMKAHKQVHHIQILLKQPSDTVFLLGLYCFGSKEHSTGVAL